jgi:hypothetical protein
MASSLSALATFTMLCAVVFLSPFALSPYAQQYDVYMSNFFMAPPYFCWEVSSSSPVWRCWA